MVLNPALLRDAHSPMMFFGPSMMQSLEVPVGGDMAKPRSLLTITNQDRH